MKKLFTIALITLSLNSFANCISAYQVYTVKEDNEGQERGKKVISAGLGSLGSGAGVYTTGYFLQGAFGPTAAYMTSSYFGGTVTTSPIITSAGTITYLMATEYKAIQKTLKQSRYGFGAEIETFKEDIEEEIKDEVSIEDLSSAIKSVNNSKIICGDKLVNYETFKREVLKALSK